MCRTCAMDHVKHLSDKGWYIIRGDYGDAIRFAQEASNNGSIKLQTLYVDSEGITQGE